MKNIFDEIREERERQDEKWGIQSHQPIVWSAILQEEAGEVAKAALEELFDTDDVDISEYRKELIQTAAVCVAAIQCLDEGYADSHSKKLERNSGMIQWNVWDTDNADGYPDSETGETFEVITTDGYIYRGQFMDWGFVPDGDSDTSLEEKEKVLMFWRKIG